MRESVRRWYDEFGWRAGAAGVYGDTALYSQAEATPAGAYEAASHRAIVPRLGTGRWLLDAASGPIPHPEYLEFSRGFARRVCADLSLVALAEARRKLGGAGACVLADVARLPFRDGTFDATVSAYTIQHVAGEDQSRAVAELLRATAPGRPCLFLTSLSPALPARALRKLVHFVARMRGKPRPAPPAAVSSPPSPLFDCPRPAAWWRSLARQLGARARIESLRVFHRDDVLALFPHSHHAVRALAHFERAVARVALPWSEYARIELVRPGRR